MSTQPTSIILSPQGHLDNSESSISDFQQAVGKLLSILRRRRWLFVIPLLSGILVSLSVSLSIPRTYTTSALFERRDDVVLTKLISSSTSGSFETLRRSLNVDATGYNALSQAIDNLGLTRNFPRNASGQLTAAGKIQKQAMIGNFTKQVTVGLAEQSPSLDIIRIAYRGDKPEAGARLLNQLKDNYIAKTQIRIAKILNSSYAFFNTQATEEKERIAQIESELQDTALRYPGADPKDRSKLEGMLTANAALLDKLQRSREETLEELDIHKRLIQGLKGQSDQQSTSATRPAALPTPGSSQNPERRKIAQEMEQIRKKIATEKARQGWTDQHPKAVALYNELEVRHAEYMRLPPRVFTGTKTFSSDKTELGSILAEDKRVEIKMELLRRELAKSDREISKQRQKQVELGKARDQLPERQQDFRLRQNELKGAQQRLTEWENHAIKLSRRLSVEAKDRGTRFTTLQVAQRPQKPVLPKLSGIYLLSAGIGLALAVSIVFLREVFDRSFRTPAQAGESLGIPVLETIGEIRVKDSSGWFSRRMIWPAVTSLQTVLITVISVLIYLSLEQPELYERLIKKSGSLWIG